MRSTTPWEIKKSKTMPPNNPLTMTSKRLPTIRASQDTDFIELPVVDDGKRYGIFTYFRRLFHKLKDAEIGCSKWQ